MPTSRILYFGTDPSRYDKQVVHCPLIETRPLLLPEHVVAEWDAFTHVLLTSPNAARILAGHMSLTGKHIFAIGIGTESVLSELGVGCAGVASFETQEGMVELLKGVDLEEAYVLYPRSSMARPLLGEFLRDRGIKCQVCDLYETVFLRPDPLPNLDAFDEVVFTSPSTIRAFIALYGKIPDNKKLTCIGPVTQEFLEKSV